MYQRCETRWLLFRLIQWHFIANNAWNLKIFMSSFLFLPFFTHIFHSPSLSTLAVRVKQEHRDDLDSPAVPPMSMPLVHAASLVCAQPLSSPEHSHPPDGLLSSSPRGLAAGLHPLQAPCAPMGSPTLPHLPHLQAQGLNAPPECQMPFHPGPAATARPSYPPIQHNMHFNGQHSLPMTAGSPQAYERMPFQADPAGCHSLGLGMVYGPASSTPTSGVPPGPGSSPSHAACTGSIQVMAPLCPSPLLSRLPLPHSRAGTITHTHAGTVGPTAPASPGLPSGRAAVRLLPHTLQCSCSYGAISPLWGPRPPNSILSLTTHPPPRLLHPTAPWGPCHSLDSLLPKLAALSWLGCPLQVPWCTRWPNRERGWTSNRSQRIESPPSVPSAYRILHLMMVSLCTLLNSVFFCLMTLESDHCNLQFGVWENK